MNLPDSKNSLLVIFLKILFSELRSGDIFVETKQQIHFERCRRGILKACARALPTFPFLLFEWPKSRQKAPGLSSRPVVLSLASLNP